MKKAGSPVSFFAILKRLDIKTLASNDKGASLTLLIDNPSDELIAALNSVHRPDEIVSVAIVRAKP